LGSQSSSKCFKREYATTSRYALRIEESNQDKNQEK